MANLVIKCPNERCARKLYNQCWKNLLKCGFKIAKCPDILRIDDLTNGDSATFIYGCRDDQPDGMVIYAHMFKQALGESEKKLRKQEKKDEEQ